MSMFRSYKDFQRIPNKNDKQIRQLSYKCDICEEGDWMSETEVEIHRKTTHTYELGDIITNKKKYGCSVCARRQKDKKSLYEHVKTEHLLSSHNAQRVEREIFICYHCTRIFFNKTLLLIHIAQKHWPYLHKSLTVECPKCSKQLKKSNMWNHLEYHHVSSVSTCPICVQKCNNRVDLKKHLESHRKYFFCNICHFSTRFQDKFHEHIDTHKRESKIHDVKLHKYFVPKKNMLKRVKLSIYSPSKGLLLPRNMRVCVICRQICVNVSDMKKHLVFDHSPEEGTKKKSYNCSVCDLEFSNNILLKQHMFKGNHRLLEEQEVIVTTSIPSAVEEVVLDSDGDAEIIMITDNNSSNTEVVPLTISSDVELIKIVP